MTMEQAIERDTFSTQACGMRPEENSGGQSTDGDLLAPDVAHGTNGAGVEIQNAECGMQNGRSLTEEPSPLTPLPSDGRGGQPGELVVCDPNLGPAEWRNEEANRRKLVLETFNGLVAGGMSRAKAAAEVGESAVTIWRWEKRFLEKGFNGLLPETERCGRKTALEKLGLNPEQIEAIINELRGLNLDLESTTAALRVYAKSDRCPESLARIILDPNRSSKHALPPSLRRAASVNKPLRKAHRGPRQLSLGGIWTPRKLDILPGDIFSSDDTTPIWAWWVPWVESEEYPFGVKLLQGQFLPVIDVASQNPLTFVLIAREKSSYRACDIAHLFGHTFETIGLPRLGWQLERGSWEANIIRGQEITYQDGEVTMSRRVGGLRGLPTNVTDWHRNKLGPDFQFPKTLQTWTSFLPKSKSIEAFFNRSQTLEGTIWGCLGRDQMRQPFEKAKRLFEQCSRPRAKVDCRLHFLSQEELVKRLVAMLDFVAHEPMEGEVFKGVPAINWDNAIRDYPMFRLPEDQRWLYRRDWKVLNITDGWARIRLTDDMTGERYSLFYSNPTVFARHEGEEICVYYDRENFEEPAQVILGRTGEFLCEARYEDRKGSFLSGDKTGHDVRKQWRNAVMSAYGTVVKFAPSRQVPAEIVGRRLVESCRLKVEGSQADSSRAGESGNVGSATRGHPGAAVQPSTFNVQSATNAPVIVDRRPAAIVAPARPVDQATQSNKWARQARIASAIRQAGARGNDE